jgi:hypothetical protein
MKNIAKSAGGTAAIARRMLLGFAFAAVAGAVAMPPAYAQRHDDRRGVVHRDYHGHSYGHRRDWGGGYAPYGYNYSSGPYYQPYGYYDPPPVVYGPPAPSVGFSFVFP